MKWVLFIVLILASTSVISQTFSELTTYLNKPYDQLDEILSKKGYKFSGATKTNDSSVNCLWAKGTNIISKKMIPDTISIIDPTLGYMGYVDVTKVGVAFVTRNEELYNKICEEMKKTSYKRISHEITTNSLLMKFENSKYSISLKKVVNDNKHTYGVIVDAKSYILGKTHIRNTE